MYCSNCGRQIKNGVKFCGNCGALAEEKRDGFADDTVIGSDELDSIDLDPTVLIGGDEDFAYHEPPFLAKPPVKKIPPVNHDIYGTNGKGQGNVRTGVAAKADRLKIPNYLLLFLMDYIPVVGFVLYIVFAFDSTNEPRRTYCRAKLIWKLLAGIPLIFIGIVLLSAGFF